MTEISEQFLRDRITQLRMQMGVSEYKMSYDLGHNRGYINNITLGRTLPSMTEFFAICDYFQVTPVEFFQGDLVNPKAVNALVEQLAALRPEDLRLVQALVDRLCKGDGQRG